MIALTPITYRRCQRRSGRTSIIEAAEARQGLGNAEPAAPRDLVTSGIRDR